MKMHKPIIVSVGLGFTLVLNVFAETCYDFTGASGETSNNQPIEIVWCDGDTVAANLSSQCLKKEFSPEGEIGITCGSNGTDTGAKCVPGTKTVTETDSYGVPPCSGGNGTCGDYQAGDPHNHVLPNSSLEGCGEDNW